MVLDVTLRDGGYLNDHRWSGARAARVVASVAAAGIPYAEVGYLATPPADPARASAWCDDAYLAALAGVSAVGLVVMVRPDRARVADLDRLVPHGVAMVRVAVGVERPAAAVPFVERARELGLAVAVNLTRASEYDPGTLARAAVEATRPGADLVYLADSNGSLFPEDVAQRVGALAGSVPAQVGFHAHDNLQLAFSNACAALGAGASALDASVAGIGKGGGNLRTELLVPYLARRYGLALRMDPLLELFPVLGAEVETRRANEPSAMVSGLLDVNLDGLLAFEERAAREGLDATVRDWPRLAAAGTRTAPAPTTDPDRRSTA